MRALSGIVLAMAAFIAVSSAGTGQANAVVCAKGVYRAGCAGYRGAAVVRRPVVAPAVRCRWVWVNGVKVRRCV
jgi:hypothetical protein